MSTLRALGGAWLSVHAPAAPAAFVRWVLERGLRAVTVSEGPRPVDWPGVARAADGFPIEFPAVFVSSVLTPSRARPDAGLASANESDRTAAVRAVAQAVDLGRRVGADVIVLEPGVVRVPGEDGPTDFGDTAVAWTPAKAQAWIARRNAVRDRALDVACRSLHRVVRAFPDARFCLGPSRDVLGLGEPAALAAIFEDLANVPLGYWHDTAVAARRAELLGTPQGAWLEAFAERMRGVTAGDCLEGGLYALPGAGSVDFALFSSYRLRRGPPLAVALEFDPGVEPTELPGAQSFLAKFGL